MTKVEAPNMRQLCKCVITPNTTPIYQGRSSGKTWGTALMFAARALHGPLTVSVLRSHGAETLEIPKGSTPEWIAKQLRKSR